MAYGLQQIESRAASVATTLTYGFKAGYLEDMNTTFPEAASTNILMLSPISWDVDMKKTVQCEIEIVCFLKQSETDTATLFTKYDTCRSRLNTFINTLCNNTNIALLSRTKSFRKFGEHVDDNECVFCSTIVKLEVQDC